MTRNEIVAFNDGVKTVLALARRSAAALEPLIVDKPTRYNFAYSALLALAEEGVALLKDISGPDAPSPVGNPTAPVGGAPAAAEAS